jgi:hypothetical protein
MTTTSRCVALFAGLLVAELAGGCGGDGNNPTLTFQSPKDGATFCTKDDLNAATPAIDVRVEVRATDLSEGTQVVLEDDQAGFSDTQPVVGGVATFTVPLAAGNNRLVAHTVDNKAVALPPITVTSNTGAPSVTILKPLEGAILGAAQDVDGDLTNGFQYDVEVRAEVEDGQTAEIYVGGVLQPSATITNKKAVFPAVTLPSGSVAIEAKVRNSCGNQGTDSAAITVETGQPGCSIEGFSPAAVIIPSPGPGTVLNISTDGDTGTAGMQTSLQVLVTPEGGTLAGLTVEVFYGSGAAPKATGTTDATGLATIALSPPDGSLVFSVRCHDAAGNTGVSQDLPVLVDTVAPDCAIALAGAGGVKPSGLFNPGDDVDSGAGGVQITATMTSAAADVVGQPTAFAINGTPVTGAVNVGAGGTASKNVTITAGDQQVSATVADRAENACTAQKLATLVEAGCALNFTNLTAASVLNIASDSATGSAGLQYGVNLEVDDACVGQTVTLASSKGGSVQQAVPTGSGMVAMTFANYTVCSGSCQEQVTLTATVEDSAGNTTVKTVTFLADNVPPAASILFIHPAGISNGGTVTPADDQNGGTAGVQVDIFVGAPADRQSLVVHVTNGATTNNFTPSSGNSVQITLGSGQNTIVADVVSATGNPGSTTPPFVVYVQDLAVNFTSPTNGAKLGLSAGTPNLGNHTLTVTVTGTVSEPANVSLTVGATNYGPVATSGGSNAWSIPNVVLPEALSTTLSATATAGGGKSGAASISVLVDVTAPDAVGSLNAVANGRAAIDLSFTAPANGTSGAGLANYLVRYARVPVTAGNFDDFGVVTAAPNVVPSGGSSEASTVSGLRVGVPYYYGVVAVDGAGNRSTVAATSTPVTLAFATTAFALPSPWQQAAQPYFGRALATGYLTNDFDLDLVIGVPLASFSTASSFEGAVLVYKGNGSGGFSSSPDFEIRGLIGSNLGWSVAVLDFDNDGNDDLAAGAPGSGGYSGAVYFWRGPLAGTLSPATADLTITHSSPAADYLGSGLSRVDFDGDGIDDLVIGAAYANGYRGEAWVIYGIDLTSWPSRSSLAVPADVATPNPADFRAWHFVYPQFAAGSNPFMGYNLHNVGKLEGTNDTTEEIAIGGGGSTVDRAFVYYGRAKPTAAPIEIDAQTASGTLTLLGPAKIGKAFAGIGDTDGNGKREIAVSSNGGDGKVWIVNGGATGTIDLSAATAPSTQVSTIITGTGGEGLGWSMANPAVIRHTGDVNGDGHSDLWVANSQTSFKAYLFFGGSTGLGGNLSTVDVPSPWYFLAPGTDGGNSTLRMLPDLNGDSLPELAAGDWYPSAPTVTVLR